ncbi:MAG: serine/threonine-protein kinase [Myxococcales bacterium]|nr:serine/threonine protein kinase [Polyangiaceae bacterium]MDW8248228.1 serine/threonine-protein kinase [Myxococcales bacterium]
MTPPLPERLGDCRILEVTTQGPLTISYRAIQEPLGRTVTVKALRSSISPASSLASRLEREAHVLAALSHGGIIALYNFVRSETAMWLVLEYVEGGSLAALLERSKNGLGTAAALSVGIALADALAHAHERGVIHRDLRPENVLLSQEGDVKLSEFEVAQNERMPSSPEPLEGTSSFGSPSHMSPEQILGEALDARSDIFSLGILLYRMLSGAHPFEAPDIRALTQRIRHDSPTPLLRIAPQVPPPIERVVAQCLEKLPDHRHPSAAILASILRRITEELDIPIGRREVAAALARAGLSGQQLASLVAHRTSPTPRREGIGRAAAGQLLVLLLMVLGGSAIQARAPGVDAGFDRHDVLELLPEHPAFLRVLARPWASVYVDGQLVDVTPFARPIPLRAGEHEILLRHPAAPEERRFIKPALHETVLVEVEMKVPAPPRPSASTPLLPTVSTSPGP